MDEAGEALGDMAEQVRQGVDALWKEGKTWAEAGMDEVKAAYEAAADAGEGRLAGHRRRHRRAVFLRGAQTGANARSCLFFMRDF